MAARHDAMIEVRRIVARLCAAVLVVVAASQTLATRPHNLMFQDQYLGTTYAGTLDPYIFANDAYSLGGWGLSADTNFTINDFISRTEQQIQNQLLTYIFQQPLDFATTDIVMLDIEAPIQPNDWGNPIHDAYRDDYLLAVKRRIEVARALLPDARLSLYAVVVPNAAGDNDSPTWLQNSWSGYTRAAELGVYDSLDLLSPHLYAAWGPDDASFWMTTIPDYTRMGIERAEVLEKTTGETLPLAPLLSFYNYNGTSNNHGQLHDHAVVRDQMHILYDYASVETVNIWAPGPGVLDIPAYLDALGMRIGDVTQDGSIDLDDVDALRDAIAGEGSGTQTAWFADVNQDDQIDSEDMRHLVQDILSYTPGDANLDGIVNGLDLSALANHWQAAGIWQDADFTGDGVVNGLDLSALAGNWQNGAAGTGADFDSAQTAFGAIPEPGPAAVLLVAMALLITRHRRGSAFP